MVIGDLVKSFLPQSLSIIFTDAKGVQIYSASSTLWGQVSYAHNCDALYQYLSTQLLLALIFMLLKGLSAQQGMKLLLLFKLIVKPAVL